VLKQDTAPDPYQEARTDKITLDISFYDSKKEVLANKSTTLLFDSWEKSSLSFEKARNIIAEESPVPKPDRAIRATTRKIVRTTLIASQENRNTG
jgi:hypothetical protein